ILRFLKGFGSRLRGAWHARVIACYCRASASKRTVLVVRQVRPTDARETGGIGTVNSDDWLLPGRFILWESRREIHSSVLEIGPSVLGPEYGSESCANLLHLVRILSHLLYSSQVTSQKLLHMVLDIRKEEH